MREIKFRGLRTDGKGWVYGGVVYPNRLIKGVWICPDINFCDFYPDQDEDKFDPDAEHKGITIGRFLEVTPESVGQFTGLKDQNGNDIYEGDIISYGTISKEVKFVTHKNQMCYGHGMYGTDINIGFLFSGYFGSIENVTVIGNVHEQK